MSGSLVASVVLCLVAVQLLHARLVLLTWFLCIRTGVLTEVTPLEACLKSKEDIHVKVGRWEWSAADPFPPLKVVLSGT